jgi:hypothetical protein
MSHAYVYAIYVGGRRVGPKYLTREDALRAARALRDTYTGGGGYVPASRRPTIRVKRILDR